MCPPYVPSLKPWMRLAVENEWPKYDAGRNVIPHSIYRMAPNFRGAQIFADWPSTSFRGSGPSVKMFAINIK